MTYHIFRFERTDKFLISNKREERNMKINEDILNALELKLSEYKEVNGVIGVHSSTSTNCSAVCNGTCSSGCRGGCKSGCGGGCQGGTTGR